MRSVIQFCIPGNVGWRSEGSSPKGAKHAKTIDRTTGLTRQATCVNVYPETNT
jgi:hypothetical protein